MKLKVVANYKSHRGAYMQGQEIDVDEALGCWLLADAPGCFEEVTKKALDKPPEDKMIAEAPRKKGRG